jgi:glutamine amidotransferase
MAHIRYATIGNVMYQNCHPYVKKDHYGRNWVLVHNGTIFEFADLNPYVKQQQGDTDSERVLWYLVDRLEDAEDALERPMSREERFGLLSALIGDLAKGNKLNLLLYDGEQLYVHTNYQNSLYYLKTDSGLLFSTQPLSREAWKLVPFTTLLAVSDGEVVLRGENHKNEYVDSEENMKYLYQIFSDL